MNINLKTMTNNEWMHFLYEIAFVRETNKDPFLDNLTGAVVNCVNGICDQFVATATIHKDYQYLSSLIRLFNEYCKLHNYDLSMEWPHMICWDKDDHKGENSGEVSKVWMDE